MTLKEWTKQKLFPANLASVTSDIYAYLNEQQVKAWLREADSATIVELEELNVQKNPLKKPKKRNHNKHICAKNILPASLLQTGRFTRRMARS